MTTDTTTPDVAGLIERLEAGVSTEPGCFHPICSDVDRADATMAEAATALRTLSDKLARVEELRMRQIDYSVDLQRIIEALCKGHDIPVPKTTARYHYDMAKAAEAKLAAMLSTLSDKLASVEEEAEKVCDSYAAENQRLYDRAEAAEAKLAALSVQEAGAEPVANIVPEHCSGKALAFEPGVLHVNKDGSGYIAVNEDDFQCEDDRCEGPDGPEGSIHWIARMTAGEMQALRDFLNGAVGRHEFQQNAHRSARRLPVSPGERAMKTAREIAAKAIYEYWSNHPACTASKSWEQESAEMPGRQRTFGYMLTQR